MEVGEELDSMGPEIMTRLAWTEVLSEIVLEEIAMVEAHLIALVQAVDPPWTEETAVHRQEETGLMTAHEMTIDLVIDAIVLVKEEALEEAQDVSNHTFDRTM